MLRLPKISAKISRTKWRKERDSILLKLYMADNKKTIPTHNGTLA
jgi:hypothetical protein